MSVKEAKARIKINKLLEAAGWRFFDDENGPANIQVEANVKITKKQFDDFGENFEKVKNGFIDFLLLDEQGKPFIVLEAKSEDKDPLVGKEQARAYAKSNFVKYVILSNGNIHYFWNIYKNYLFYRYKNNANEYAEKELGISGYRCVKEGGEFPVYECPECGEEQLVYDAEAGRFHYFSCDQNFTTDKLSFCPNCGQLMYNNGETVCDDCFEHALNKD